MGLIGENLAEFNTHSFRIGGATALFAAGADMTVIKTLGRRSSDIYQLYVRACRERCIEWTRKAGWPARRASPPTHRVRLREEGV